MSLKVFTITMNNGKKSIQVALCEQDAEVFENFLSGLKECFELADTLLGTATAETPKEIVAAAEAALKKARSEL